MLSPSFDVRTTACPINIDMKSFAAYLIESLNSSYPITVIRDDVTPSGVVKYGFTFADEKDVKFTVHMRFHHDMEWYDNSPKKIRFMEVDFHSNGAFHPTGQAANPLRVYSTIGQHVVWFAKKHSVELIYFTAAHERTLTVYEKLAKRLAANMNGRLVHVGREFQVWINK